MRHDGQRESVPKSGRRTSGKPRVHGSSGFTLIELLLAMSILFIAVMSISAATLRSHDLRRHSRERVLAMNAIRSMSERIQSLATISAGDANLNWSQEVLIVYGPGGTFGDAFDVEGLTPLIEGESVGSIEILLDETLTDLDVGSILGLPRDLDGDGAAATTDVSFSARILPVVLRVEWTGNSGPQEITHAFYVLGY